MDDVHVVSSTSAQAAGKNANRARMAAQFKSRPDTIYVRKPVTIEVYAQDDPYQYVTVTGIAELEESEEANRHIDKLSEKYTGNPKFQSHRPTERRVIVRVKPERVS